MVLVSPCHSSSRRESPPACRKKKVKWYERKNRSYPCQPAGWLFGHQEFPFHSPCPPAPVHTLDIKSSSGTSVFVSLLLSFFVALLTNERPVVSSFFENRLVLEILIVGSNLTTLSISLSTYTSSARIITCESNNMRATAILLTALVAILPAMGEKSKQIFSHDDPIYGGT